MKNQIFAITALITLSAQAFAQTNVVPPSGSVGININSPLPNYPFTLNTDIDFDYIQDFRNINAHSDLAGLKLFANSNRMNGGAIELHGDNHTSDHPSSVRLFSPTTLTTQPDGTAFAFAHGVWDANQNFDIEYSLFARNDQQVVIGKHTSSPGVEYGDKLTVQGAIALFEPDPNNYRTIRARGNQSGLALYSNYDWTDGSSILLSGNSTGTYNPHPGSISLVTHATGTDVALRVTDGSFTNHMTIDGYANMNLGGNFSFMNSTANKSISGKTNNSLSIYGNSTWADGGSIFLRGAGTGSNPGSVVLVAGELGQPSDKSFAFAKWKTDTNNPSLSTWHYQMSITNDGQVVIGNVPTINSNSYKLYVEDGILTERIKVATVGTGNWSDFVFADDYNLKPLNDVEQFITKNKHLPDVPSACDVEKDGYDLTNMDATLLQKIEELTLYVIQQQKEITKLYEKINILTK